MEEREIDWSQTKMKGKIAKQLGAVTELDNVARVKLGFAQLDNEDMTALVGGLLKQPRCSLTSLELEDNSIGERGAALLVAHLHHAPNLRLLNFAGNPLVDEPDVDGAHAFTRQLGSFLPRSSILSLNLSRSRLSEDSISVLFSSFVASCLLFAPPSAALPSSFSSPSISSPSISSPSISSPSLSAPGPCQWHGLEEIDLSFTSVGAKGASQMKNFIEYNPQLRSCGLRECGIPSDEEQEGASVARSILAGVVAAVKQHPSLTSVRLEGSRLRSFGLAPIFARNRHNSSMRTITLFSLLLSNPLQ